MPLTSSQRNWVVFLGAAAITIAVAWAYFGVAGVTAESVRVALRSSAHASFVVLLVVFIARPLRQIVQTPATAALLGNRRLFGVAFAGIHTAHLGLILYQARVVPGYSFNIAENALGGVVYLLIFLMFATSFDSTARALGPKRWRILHKTGLYAIFIAALQTIIPDSREQIFGINGALTLLAAAAIVIRLTVFLAKRQRA